MSYGNEAVSLEQALAEDAAAPKAKKEKKLKAVKEPKEPKEPKDPNAVRATPVRRIPSDKASTYAIVNGEKIASYKGARAMYAALLVDGGSIVDYVAAGGTIGFLSFYVAEGVVAFA